MDMRLKPTSSNFSGILYVETELHFLWVVCPEWRETGAKFSDNLVNGGL